MFRRVLAIVACAVGPVLAAQSETASFTISAADSFSPAGSGGPAQNFTLADDTDGSSTVSLPKYNGSATLVAAYITIDKPTVAMDHESLFVAPPLITNGIYTSGYGFDVDLDGPFLPNLADDFNTTASYLPGSTTSHAASSNHAPVFATLLIVLTDPADLAAVSGTGTLDYELTGNVSVNAEGFVFPGSTAETVATGDFEATITIRYVTQ